LAFTSVYSHVSLGVLQLLDGPVTVLDELNSRKDFLDVLPVDYILAIDLVARDFFDIGGS